MQYFVSVENSSYFYWQLELLIESFLEHNMQDQLVIGFAENDDQKIKGFSTNLVKYGIKFFHENEGREKKYLPLNQLHSIRYALGAGFLKPPFALIHADMVMRKPIELTEEDKKISIIINNYEEISKSQKEIINKKIELKRKDLAKERGVEEDVIPKFPCVSAPVIFNESSADSLEIFFTNFHSNIEKLLKEEKEGFPAYRTAFEMILTESFQHLTMKGSFLSAGLLHEEDNLNFIHYKSGIPPVFNKKFYKYQEGIFYYGQDPYEMILENNPTVNTNYVQKLIRKYNKKRFQKV